MAEEVVMPRLSDTMETGTIAKWVKHEGDAVAKGDTIAEIETDKANMELESYANGVLARILVAEGQSAGLGEPIAVIAANQEEADKLKGSPPEQAKEQTTGRAETGAQPASGRGELRSPEAQAQAGSDGPAASAAPAAQAPAQTAAPDQDQPSQGPPAAPQVGKTEPNERIKASPLARRLAQEHDIDLQNVAGTGPGGRITKEDVESFLKQVAPIGQPAEAQPAQAAAPAQPAAPARPAPQPAPGNLRQPQPVEMTRMQQTIARRMTEARFSAPDFVLTMEVDMTEARALLQRLKEVEGAPRIGPNDLLIKATAAALHQHPEVNAGWENDTIVRYGRINIGNAVAVEGGLVVPVILDADKKSLGQIAQESKELIDKAHGGKLAPSDYEGATFTISNLGMYGIEQFTAVINIPEACILAVGAITPQPAVVNGEVTVRDRMHLTLSCDHRVINGAQGAEFLQTLRRLLENPMLVVL